MLVQEAGGQPGRERGRAMRCSPLGAARCPPSAEAPGAVRAGGSPEISILECKEQDTSCLGLGGWEMGAHLPPSLLPCARDGTRLAQK